MRPPFGPPSGPPFGPPFGRPPTGPPSSRPPSRPPTGPPGPPFTPPGFDGGPPTSPPPRFTPDFAPYRVDPGSLRFCRNRYTYIWLDRGGSFWFYPVFIGRRSVAGYRWIGFTWIYYGIDTDRISSFFCS